MSVICHWDFETESKEASKLIINNGDLDMLRDPDHDFFNRLFYWCYSTPRRTSLRTLPPLPSLASFD